MTDLRPCNEKWTTGPHPSQRHACQRDEGHEPEVHDFGRPVDHICRCGSRTHDPLAAIAPDDALRLPSAVSDA